MNIKTDPKLLLEIMKVFINVLFTEEDKMRLDYFNSCHPVSEPVKTGVDPIAWVKDNNELFNRLICDIGNLLNDPKLARDRLSKETTVTQIALYQYCLYSLDLLNDCNILFEGVPDGIGNLFVWILREIDFDGIIRYYY